MEAKVNYEFSGKLWQHDGQGGWYFISLPNHISNEIRGNLQWQEEGWGRMKASAEIDKIKWDTAIWFDKKQNTYLLPVKAEIRKKAFLKTDDVISVVVTV